MPKKHFARALPVQTTNMRAQDFVTATVQYHDTLSPTAWHNETLRTEVRDKLIEIAKVFIGYLEIPDFEILDIVLAGSMANYNYTRFSDFDLHVVTRYSDLQCDDLASAFYHAKKTIWNNEHDINIGLHEVELYVEDVEQAPVSGGIYSILKNEWLEKPTYEKPSIEGHSVTTKVHDLVVQIDHAIETADDPEDLKRLTDKLRKIRRNGLDTHGEFGVENLTFKVLRNMGYIEKLHNAYLQKQDQQLSLPN
jgi:predicted nucleotidyltransferase